MPDPINLGNSAAALDGKTLVTAEDAVTVSGNHTFDRGTSAPFTVANSGAAAVANLDADKLDGQHGAFYRDAGNLNAGTVPASQIPNPLPAVSGEDLTNLPAANLVGALPAISGAALTNLPNADVVVTLADGATPALDASAGTVFRLAAEGDRTIAVPSNPVAGRKIIIQHYASGGARTLALNTGAGGFRFGADITELTETASGKTDYVGAVYNGTDSRWDVVGYVKGY